jgi:hypothetical protein
MQITERQKEQSMTFLRPSALYGVGISQGGKGRAMTTTVKTRSAATLNPTRQQLDELDALLQRMLELPVAKLDASEPSASEPVEEPTLPAEEPVALRSAPAAVSYMVVETASPRPLPLASGFAPQPSALTPRLVPVTPAPQMETSETEAPALGTPPQAEEEPAPAEADAPPVGADEIWVPLRSTWQPSAQTWPPLADSWHQANGSMPPVEAPAPQLEITPPSEAPATPPAPEPFAALTEPAPEAAKEPTPPPAPVVEPRLSLSAADAPESGSNLLLPLVWFNQGFDACLAPLGPVGRWLSGPSGRQLLGFVGLASLAAATAIAILAGLGCTW